MVKTKDVYFVGKRRWERFNTWLTGRSDIEILAIGCFKQHVEGHTKRKRVLYIEYRRKEHDVGTNRSECLVDTCAPCKQSSESLS